MDRIRTDTQTVIPQMKTGFLIFSEIDRKSSKIKALNDFG